MRYFFMVMGLFVSILLRIDLSFADVLQRTLDNGLRVVIMENHASPVATMRVYVNAGSIWEQEYLGAGISHYCEHLISGGSTKNRTEEETERIIQSIGGASNAYTSSDHTCYYLATSNLYFDTCIDLLSDWIKNCSFEPKEIEREKGVILKEINMIDDAPSRRLSKIYNETMFLKHPEHFPIIGYAELFKKLTREDLLKYYQRMYTPQNIIVVAVGDFDSKEILTKIEKAFADFKGNPIPSIYIEPDPKQMGTRKVEQEMDVNLTYLLMGFRTVPITHLDMYPLDVLAYILSRGESSRLYREIKDKRQLVHSISASSYTPRYDAADFTIEATLDYPNIHKAETAILEEIYRLKKEFVSDEEVKKAKTQIVSEHVFSNQTVESQADVFGRNVVHTGNPLFHERYIENIKKVTKEDIQRVVNTYFYNDTLTSAVIKPKGAKVEEVEAAKKEIKTGKVDKIILDNGMTLLLKRNESVPLVYIEAYLKGGVRYENELNNGVFNFMSRMLLKGTKNRTAEQIAKEIDSIGGGISAAGAEDYFSCAVDVLKEDITTGIDLLADVLMNPIFAEEELEKERKAILADIDSIEDDWKSQAEVFFRKTFYQKSPYRFIPLGTKDSMANLMRQDLVETHKKYCLPNNIILVVFGDIDPEITKELITAKFKGFKPAELAFPEVSQEEAQPGGTPVTSNREAVQYLDRKQSVIFMGYPGMRVGDKDWHTMRVIDAITSGIGYPGGWLHNTLRGNQLVYFVHAWNDVKQDTGYYAIQAATTEENLDKALTIIREKQDLIKNQEVSDEELDRAKKACIVMESLYLKQTNSAQGSLAAQYELYGLGYGWRDDLIEKINAVTKKDIKRVANQYFNNYVLTITRPNTEEKK
ncbi:MAG: pitrilysin family protein [bacterium]|nr:pitrilysin family protein [bacterium]